MRGILARFAELDAMLDAVRDVRRLGVGEVTVYSPTPRHEIEDAVQAPTSPVRRYTLIGGLLGVTFGYWVAIWTSTWWPMVVGGKPIPSWIPYTVIGFELMVMFGGLATVAGLFIHSRVPKIGAVVGYDPRFSHGDFGIYVECAPERQAEVEQTIRRHGPLEVRGER